MPGNLILDDQESFITVDTLDVYSQSYDTWPLYECNTTQRHKYYGQAFVYSHQQQCCVDALQHTRYDVLCGADDNHNAQDGKKNKCFTHNERTTEKYVAYDVTHELSAITHMPTYVQDTMNQFVHGYQATFNLSHFFKNMYYNANITYDVKTNIAIADYDNNNTYHIVHLINVASSVYLNVVHDCNRVCIASSISDKYIKADTIIHRDSMLCVHMLADYINADSVNNTTAVTHYTHQIDANTTHISTDSAVTYTNISALTTHAHASLRGVNTKDAHISAAMLFTSCLSAGAVVLAVIAFIKYGNNIIARNARACIANVMCHFTATPATQRAQVIDIEQEMPLRVE